MGRLRTLVHERKEAAGGQETGVSSQLSARPRELITEN